MAAMVAPRIATGYGRLQTVLPPDSLPARIVLSVAIPILTGSLAGSSPPYFGGFSATALHSRPEMDRPARFARPVLVFDSGSLAALACVDGHCHARRRQRRPRRPRLGGAFALSPDGFHRPGKLRNVSAQFPMHPFCSRRARQHRSALPPAIFPIGAYVSYRYFETPFLALKTRFSRLNTAAAKPSIPPRATPVASESAQPS